MNGMLPIMFTAATTTATLLGLIVVTANGAFAQEQNPAIDGTSKQDRNQTRLMDPTIHRNATSFGSQQSIMPSPPLNQSTSQVSTISNATLSVKSDEQFYLPLSSNPTTGY